MALTKTLPLANVPFPDPEWAGQAACRGKTDLFFTGRKGVPEEVRELCGGCPVLAQCREFGLAWPQLSGVWGGLQQRTRAKLAARRRAAA